VINIYKILIGISEGNGPLGRFKRIPEDSPDKLLKWFTRKYSQIDIVDLIQIAQDGSTGYTFRFHKRPVVS
jgi:uncharacterized protein (DUF3820 family)